MDAYLSREALSRLKACLFLAGRSAAAGFLLGHKRGHRIFVESVFPTATGFVPSVRKYREADAALGGKIIGFFSHKKSTQTELKILRPFALGKLYLEILSFSASEVKMLASIIDFDGAFTLVPLKLSLPAGRKDGKGRR